ncbi:hypothetical protein [Piscinibacter sp. XHJ-5]|uniref:hypothetical protein n=1 Tax=Piscinibacter sp. XHJ-5 TaxID=3037797 RepID=UPI0024532E9C|nr:hypothetical protein [Piscinibacter sp. XHJ-5]
MVLLQPMLINARALLEALFLRRRAADETAATAQRGGSDSTTPGPGASEHPANGVPEECAAPPSDRCLQAALVMRRVRHFEQDVGRGA